MEDVLISLQGIRKNYGRHAVLKGIDMEVKKGDIYGLIGRNGCGKTTIFKVILGLSDFQGGKLAIGNPGDSLLTGRKRIGFFIGENFFGYLSAKENLEYYRTMKNIKSKDEVERVLEIVGLGSAKGPYRAFSLGMKQRLGIANAIMGNPEVLILDEPVNGLDPQGIVDVRNLIKRLNAEYGMTVIVSSHILDELQHTASVFGIVNNGVIVKTVTQEELSVGKQVIKISVDDMERASQILQENGIDILSKERDTLNLEDYYCNIIKEE